MKRTFDDIFPPTLLTYISDRSIDYTLEPDQEGLNDMQKQSLMSDLGREIEHMVNVRQVHEDNIIVADKKEQGVKEADGLITNEKEVALAIRTADCLSLFLYDSVHQAIGLIHCGWESTRLGILGKALDMMKEHYTSQPADMMVAIGPGIRGCHYEVGKEFIDFFPEDVDKKDDAYYLDLAAVNHKVLLRAGVKEKNIHDCKVCTYCDEMCFSYRREGETAGRMLSLMMIKSSNN